MLIGYVSDERYVALPDVLLEFEEEQGYVSTGQSRPAPELPGRLWPICVRELTASPQ